MRDFLYEFFKDNTLNSYLIFLSPFLIYWLIYDIKNKESNTIVRFLSFIINAAWIVSLIKGILQVPLPQYPNTFALPSGHTYMKMSVMLAVMQIIVVKNKPFAYSVGIIFGLLEGLRTIYYGYHSVPDVLAAVSICFIQGLLFYEIIFKYKLSNVTLILGIIMNPVVVFIMKYHAPQYNIAGLYNMSYTAITALVILFIGRKVFSRWSQNNKF